MRTTYFRPSIHGWPFRNSFTYSLGFKGTTMQQGFCGGMCWTALNRFYAGVGIPRGTQSPAQGDALYNEILDEQKASLAGPPTAPGAKLWQIYEWQQSPDLSHQLDPHHSLGHKTQQEWPDVKLLLDSSKPVTLTLIAHSNDYNPGHLSDNHRVVAYAYEERPLRDGEWVHGNRRPNIRHVTISIYDPNYPYDPYRPGCDDVSLTFYTGCDDSWIHLRHSEDDEFHGFFLDDKDRSYASADSTSVSISSCVQTGISSATEADYDLKFSWRCRFIPYFSIRVNGVDWQYNAPAKAGYPPADLDNKQCQAMTGSETVNLKLPRALSELEVRLLGSDDYSESLEVDARPAIVCYPYVRNRGLGEAPGVCDSAIADADLFIKVAAPTPAEVQQLDISPFRWVMIQHPRVIDNRTQRDDLTTAVVEVIRSYRLGNVAVPVLANFVEKNLAAPTQTSGVVVIRRGQTEQLTNLTTLTTQGQRIFDGFTDDPADYDNDTRVELVYRSMDRFGIVVQEQAEFYGKSILYSEIAITLHAFDPAKVARLEAAARELIEQGLIDIAIGLPHRPPRPSPDPLVLLQRLHSHQQIQSIIDQSLGALWKDPDIWRDVWKAQSVLLKQGDGAVAIGKPAKLGYGLKTANKLMEAEQRKYDAVIVNTFMQKAIEQVRQDPTVIEELKKL